MRFKWRDIAILLVIPASILAKVIDLSKYLNFDFSYQPFTLKHLVLFSFILGLLAVVTYKSISNLLSLSSKITPRLQQLLSYLGAVVILLAGNILSLQYVFNVTESEDGFSMMWPASFNTNIPVAFDARLFVFNLIVGIAISCLIVMLLKKIFNKKQTLQR